MLIEDQNSVLQSGYSGHGVHNNIYFLPEKAGIVGENKKPKNQRFNNSDVRVFTNHVCTPKNHPVHLLGF